MPKVIKIEKSRKDYPDFGIKKGDTYYKWSFNFGPTMKSLTPPRRSQLTRSDFLGQLWDMEDGLEERFSGIETEDDFQSEIDSLIDEIQSLIDEQQERLDNMPEQLQETSSAGETIRERIEYLESWMSDLQSVDVSMDDGLTENERVDRLEEIRDEITSTSSGC